MAGMGRCISKRTGSGPTRPPLPTRPLTDEAPQRSRAPAGGPPHINITRAPGADSGLATLARDFTAASPPLTPRPRLRWHASLSPRPGLLSAHSPGTHQGSRPGTAGRRPRQAQDSQGPNSGALSVQASAPPLGGRDPADPQVGPEASSSDRRSSPGDGSRLVRSDAKHRSQETAPNGCSDLCDCNRLQNPCKVAITCMRAGLGLKGGKRKKRKCRGLGKASRRESGASRTLPPHLLELLPHWTHADAGRGRPGALEPAQSRQPGISAETPRGQAR